MDENSRNNEENSGNKAVSNRKLSSVVRDMDGILNFGKKVYANRAVISRRVNTVSIVSSFIFLLIYIAYVIFSGLADKLSVNIRIVSIVLIAAYGVAFIGIIIAAVWSRRAKAKSAKVVRRFIKILRYVTKLISLAITITCLVLSITSGSESNLGIALDTVMLIIAIILAVFQGVLLVSGGIGGFVKWLISPVKRKVRFSAVAMEWYQLLTTGDNLKGSISKVSNKYFEQIEIVLDNRFIPDMGKKYIRSITADDITLSLGSLNPELLPVGEGTIKKVFAYARECGYISENPCDTLALEGSVNKEESAISKAKNKAVGAIKGKLGRGIASLLNSGYDSLVSDDDD